MMLIFVSWLPSWLKPFWAIADIRSKASSARANELGAPSQASQPLKPSARAIGPPGRPERGAKEIPYSSVSESRATDGAGDMQWDRHQHDD